MLCVGSLTSHGVDAEQLPPCEINIVIPEHPVHAVQLSAALERVRAGADIMPRRQLEKVLVAELGDSWKEKVANFEYDPIAAASIGQVSHQLLTN